MNIHKSNSDNFLWFIESITEKEQTFNIKGWICSFTHRIDDLFFNDELMKINFIERPDVKEFYVDILSDKCGFNFEISKNLFQESVYVISDNIKYELGTMLKWFVYYSGYNNLNKDLIVVENFYKNPDLIRDYAINNLNFIGTDFHKGKRSEQKFVLDGTKEHLEYILGRNIINWDFERYANGVFQYCTADQPIVYHVDSQSMAGVVFLTKNAPLNSGTSFYKSKFTDKFRFETATLEDPDYVRTFTGDYNINPNFYDSTLYEKVDEVANVYNRLVIWDAKKIHAATRYFGDDLHNSRFFHLFFFDVI
jgi:hypothetical protein